MEIVVAALGVLIGLFWLVVSISVWRYQASFPVTWFGAVPLAMVLLLAFCSICVPDFMFIKFGTNFDPDVRDFYSVSFLPIFRIGVALLAIVSVAGCLRSLFRVKTSPAQPSIG